MYLLERLKSKFVCFALSGCFLIGSITSSSKALGQQTTVVFQDDFESGPGTWSADNGLWEVGIATVGPDTAHSGQNLTGTVLNGNYSDGANTRFISPAISLPNLSPNEKLFLKFWYWFKNRDDAGQVQISVNGGAWETISETVIDGSSPVWTQYVAALTQYANSNVRIGFFFTSDGSGVDNGWYIDDVSISQGPEDFRNPEDFEFGVGNWSADNGLWEVGILNMTGVGPDTAHSTKNVAGTVLNGNYEDGANTRFISPEVTLTPKPGEKPVFCFWGWFRNRDDAGRVQISVDSGPWQTISTTIFDGTSIVWTQVCIDVSSYSNSTVRFAFFFSSDGSGADNGWYIDDIRIEGIVDTVTTSVDESEASIPTQFALQQNYPNPFNPTTTIRYQLPEASDVALIIYSLSGQNVRTLLLNERQSDGAHQIQWDGRNEKGLPVSSGVYLYRLKAGAFIQTRKMLLLR